MVAGWVVSLVMAVSGSTQAGQGAYESLWVAAAISAVTAIYCLTLPHTPPLAVGPGRTGAVPRRDRAGPPAGHRGVPRDLLRRLPHPAPGLPGHPRVPRGIGLAPRLGLDGDDPGPDTEIAMLAVLPWLLRRFGLKATLMLGIFAWFARFLSLSLGPPLWLAVAGNLVHGVGFACFTVGGQVYMDGRAPRHLRASAQALLLVATSGIALVPREPARGRDRGPDPAR